jgi:signal transduction histidine kinase
MLLHQVDQTYDKLQTELAQAEEAVRRRTEQLIGSASQAYSFLDALNMGLVVCDLSPEVVMTNSAVAAMLNGKTGTRTSWKLAEMEQLLEPGAALLQQVRSSLKTNQAVKLKGVHCGELVLRLLITPMSNPSQGARQQIGAVILVEDITEQTVMERSKDEFFFIASHELRTPLTAIRSNSSLLSSYFFKDKVNDPLMSEMIQDIHESSVRLIGIVNDFLDVSALEQRKIEMRPEDFVLKEAVGEVLRDLTSVARAKSDELLIDDSLATVPTVTADRQRIKQVIYNLIGNAIKFTDKGKITVGGSFDGTMVQCWVKDSGQGMTEESHKLLFRKFQQAGANLLNRDTAKGTGLGLYISKLIVEATGGKITLEQSKLNEGSTFAFTLPAAAKPAPAAAAAAAPQPGPASKT